MSTVGNIIGSALNLGASIFGGVTASNAMKKAMRNVEQQRNANQNWYDRRYNEDATQRADAQRILSLTEESIKQRNKAAEGAAAVMGGTDESVAAAKAANNRALANATSLIAANADARKDNIEATYRENDDMYVDKLNDYQHRKAEAVSTAVKEAGNAAAKIAENF